MSAAIDQRLGAFANRRPVLATLLSLAHLAVGFCFVASVVYLLYLTRSPAVLRNKDTADVVRGLNIAALVVGPVAVPYLASALGLWKGRQWGWVVAVATNALAAAVFIMDAIDQRHVAWDDAFVAAIFPVLLIMLFLRPVRAWCWRRSSLRPRASGVVA